ncbi:MAG: TVP38/TMEM64 family protein [Nitrospirota bacterium]|nr:TVP38/TMEM64 family protein [Nitrospirota bacterium]
MTAHAKKISLLVLFVALIAGLRFSGLADSLTLENLQRNREALLSWVEGHRTLSFIVYILVYIAVVAFSLPGGAVMTLAGGYLFGTVPAVLCVVVGATCGAVLSFLSARYLIGSRVQERYAAQLARFNSEMDRNGGRYLLTLRLIPLFPFFLVNFLSGLTRVSLGLFTWTTAVGIIPGTAAFAFAGHQLESVKNVGDILSPRVLLALGILAAFTLLPALWSRIRKKP